MNQNVLSQVLEFLRRKMWNRRWQRAVTCLAAVAVFGVTYALILPAITLTGKYPSLKAEELVAWSGDELSVQLTAESDFENGERTVVLTMEGEDADLSDSYVFDENGICVITDKDGNEFEIHRTVREDKENVVDYWFTLGAGQDTVLTLNLADAVSAERFAELVEAMKKDKEAESAKATASDAGKSGAVAVVTASASDAESNAAAAITETSRATASNAEKAPSGNTASSSNADIAEANTQAKTEEEKIVIEKDDDGFEQILDGAIINDLEVEEEEEGEQTLIVATLKLSAGIGEDYEAAVKDAERNADKRGDAQLVLKWKDVIVENSSESVLTGYVNDATVAVFYDSEAEIPEDAVLSVSEIVKGTEEYEEYLAQTKNVMADATASDASKSVTKARFFNIKILNESGIEIEPCAPVKVVISYDDVLTIAEDGNMNVLHFGNDAAEVLKASALSNEENSSVEAVGFTANSFSVYAIFGMETVTAQYVTADGATFSIKVSLNEKEDIRGTLSLEVREITGEEEEYAEYYASAQTAMELEEGEEITKARFFDITLFQDGEKFEPVYPATVQITCDESLDIQDNQEVEMVHFAEEKTEVISEVKVNDSGNELTYEQNGFSVVGVIVRTNTKNFWPENPGDYVMVVGSESGGYYIINHNTLEAVPVEFDAENHKITLNNAAAEAQSDLYMWTTNATGDEVNSQGNLGVTGTENYLDFMAEGLISTQKRNYRWNGNRKLYSRFYNENHYFALTGTPLKLEQTTSADDALDVYFSLWGVTLQLYPCEYNSNRAATYQHYLPVNGAPISVVVPSKDIIVTQGEDIDDAATPIHVPYVNYKIPIEYFDGLKAYGFNPDEGDCPLVNGIAEDIFRNNVVKTTSHGVLTGGYSPYSDSYEIIDGKKYVVLRSDAADSDKAEKDWRNVFFAKLTVADDTVSPASTTINVFDYWPTTNRFDNDAFWHYEGGINKDHRLHFFYANTNGYPNTGGGTFSNTGAINRSMATNGCVQGLVNRNLNSRGYPYLAIDKDGYPGGTRYQDDLDYLFDPKMNHPGKLAFENVTGLLRVNDAGNYFYNSAERGVEFNEVTKTFTEYTTPVMVPGGQSVYGQFFPFENAHQVAVQSDLGRDIQHFFGMTMTTRFAQMYGGFTDHEDVPGRQKVIYHFKGDDDLWVFIDGVLVGDVGGAHSDHALDIDFSTGDVTVKYVYRDADTVYGNRVKTQTTNIKQQYELAGRADEFQWNGNTFADETYHTLKMFYMERGNFDSNLELEFNMLDIKPTSIYKLDQYGQPVAGAEFSVYKTGANYQYSTSDEPAFVGVTDEKGELVFKDKEGSIYSSLELKDLFGLHFVLVETGVPEGYQDVGAIHMKFEGDALVCDNMEDTGVYAANSLLITAPNVLNLSDGSSINYYHTGDPHSINGKLFSLVMKKQGDEYYPVYGTSATGFHVLDDNSIGGIEQARDAQKALEDIYFNYVTGAMQGNMDNLPGDIKEYEEYSGGGGSADRQYRIGFFWEDDDGNISPVTTSHSFFKLAWGATIHVPNYENRFYYQKLDKNGAYLNGAGFALYTANDTCDGYIADGAGTVIFLDEDQDKDNQGTAHVGAKDADAVPYTVDPGSGVITVGSGTGSYTISPAVNASDQAMYAETLDYTATVDVSGDEALAGTNDFYGIKSGKYILREVKAPEHYELNPAQIPVIVDQGNVYVNAGGTDDGVQVGIEVGRLAPSLFEMVNGPGLNETLTWLISTFKTSADADPTVNTATWGVSGDPKALEYDSDENSALSWFDYMNEGSSSKEDIRHFTDTGWSKLEIDQNSSHQIDPGTAYLNLPGDISRFFGKAVFVQVEDEKLHETEILKVSAENHDTTLSGVKFDLYKTSYDDAANRIMQDITTDANGKLSLGELNSGIYWLVETVAANGYLKGNPVKIIVTPEGTTYEQEGNPIDNSSTGNGTGVSHYTKEDTGAEVFVIKVINSRGVELPHTGGPGTTLYTLGGLMLLLVSALLYGFRRRHEERRAA